MASLHINGSLFVDDEEFSLSSIINSLNAYTDTPADTIDDLIKSKIEYGLSLIPGNRQRWNCMFFRWMGRKELWIYYSIKNAKWSLCRLYIF
jgi:hypothetical protein